MLVWSILRTKCRFAYINVADPVASMLACARRSRQGVVGSLLMLLGSIRLTACLHSLLDLVGWTRLVKGCPDLVILRLLCPGLHVGSAVAMVVVWGVKVVWPVATVASNGGVVGISSSRASLSARVSHPRALSCIHLQWCNVRRSPIPIPPWDDVSDPPEKKKKQLNQWLFALQIAHSTQAELNSVPYHLKISSTNPLKIKI